MNNRQLFQSLIAQTSPFPLSLEIVDSDGIYLIDINGKRYADLISGIGVSIIGHKNPAVIGAITSQINKYMHTMVYGEHIMAPQTQLAKCIIDLLSPGLDNVYFVNSGTEAMEGALKLAKKYTKRSEIISCKHAYHGSTAGSASLMSDSTFTGPSRPHLPGVKHIAFNSFEAIDNITERTAAVVIEVIQAEAGIILGHVEWLKAIREKCTSTRTLLIIDEIQTGLGRTGKWFAFEHYSIQPDILLLGKGLGGGLPLAAFIAGKKIMATLSIDPMLSHITTFGGNPVSCVASLATLDFIKSEGLIHQIPEKEKIIIDAIGNIPHIKLRIKGLLGAIQLDNFEKVQNVCASLMDKGVLVDWFLFNDSSIRLAPPLTISMEELKDNMLIITNYLN